MPLDECFKTFAGNGLDERCGHHVGCLEPCPDECLHTTEARLLRLCVAHPSKEYQQNECATDITMDGGNLSPL
jgi:hypothetical protein